MITKLLKAEEVASIMDVSKSFVYLLIRTGELPAVRFGTAVRVRPEDLDEFISSSLTTSNQLPSVYPGSANKGKRQ